MNLVTPREPFVQHIQFAASVCPTRSTRPILRDLLVEVEGNQVQVTATDGEVSVRQRYVDDGVSGDGRSALPAATLLSAVRSMAGEEIRIREADGAHELTGERAYFRLNGDDPELFPSIPILEHERGIELPLSSFLDLCHRTTFAAAKEMGRYAFNGVLLEVDPDEITLVATDGRRLSMARLGIPTGVSKRFSVVIPIKGLMQLQRAAVEGGETLRIELRETMVAFLLPSTEILAQLVEGEFPDFRAVIPATEDIPSSVSIGREELAGAIQRATITAGDEGPSVELVFKKGNLQIKSRHEGLGESRSDVEVQYQGDEVDIRFNPNFLGEYLKTMPEDVVTFRFKDRTSAGVFATSEASMYLVMPITS